MPRKTGRLTKTRPRKGRRRHFPIYGFVNMAPWMRCSAFDNEDIEPGKTIQYGVNHVVKLFQNLFIGSGDNLNHFELKIMGFQVYDEGCRTLTLSVYNYATDFSKFDKITTGMVRSSVTRPTRFEHWYRPSHIVPFSTEDPNLDELIFNCGIGQTVNTTYAKRLYVTFAIQYRLVTIIVGKDAADQVPQTVQLTAKLPTY